MFLKNRALYVEKRAPIGGHLKDLVMNSLKSFVPQLQQTIRDEMAGTLQKRLLGEVYLYSVKTEDGAVGGFIQNALSAPDTLFVNTLKAIRGVLGRFFDGCQTPARAVVGYLC